jgi:hypothetical protein
VRNAVLFLASAKKGRSWDNFAGNLWAEGIRGAEVIRVHGLPCALYTDRPSHYFVTPKGRREGRQAKDQPTQVGRALAALEARGLEYIVGVRERTSKEVRTVVLGDGSPFVPLVIPRQRRPHTELEAKAVILGDRRYIVCRNLAEAAKDAADRAAIVANLRQALRRGAKALVGNAGYRRFLKAPAQGFAIDEERVAEDARFDGIFVLRTNTTLDPLQAMLRYRELQGVEQLFRSAKSLLAARPIFHKCDATIRGHVFCSFLALVLKKELADRCAARGLQPEWDEVWRDLDRLQEVEVEQDGKRFVLRTPVVGCAGKLFQTLGVALPPNIRDATPKAAETIAEPSQL